MIRVFQRDLPGPAQSYLDRLQGTVNGAGDFAKQVELARQAWEDKDVKYLKDVRKVLDEMTVAGCCHYCEDSRADEVEHVRPKALYPERAFDWSNYLYACGPCNSTYKRDQFAIIDAQGVRVDVTRKRRAPVLPPQEGEAALVDPRCEDPADFLWLDLFGTFRFEPRAGSEDPLAHGKASFTIDVLQLNRDYLIWARRTAFKNYCSRLRTYIADRQRPEVSAEVLQEEHAALWRERHTTVWREMVRFQAHIPALAALFRQAPELAPRMNNS